MTHDVTKADAPKRDSSRPSAPPSALASNASGDPSREFRDVMGSSGAGPGGPPSRGAASNAPRSSSPVEDDDGKDGKDGKKERVLHTRVPAVLERELKRFADNLRVPVSNLVRTILEDALSVADAASGSVEERLRRAASHLEKEREKLKKRLEHDPLTGIVAFQEVMLAVPAACAKCAATLARGSRAHLGIGDGPGERVFVCDECKPRG